MRRAPGPKAHRNNELCFPTHSKQRFIIAVPSHMRRPSPMKVQVRCSEHVPFSTPGLHQGSDSPPHSRASSGQHRSPDCGPTAVPRPYKYEQEHEEIGWTANAVRNDPFLNQFANAANAKSALLPNKATRNNHTPDLPVFLHQ